MLGAARVGLGMLATRTGPGARPRVAGIGALGSQRGMRFFPRFFARMNPPREQQKQQPPPPPPPPQQPGEKGTEEKPHPEHHKPGDVGIVNPVNLPGTGVGMFGFGAGGGSDAVVTTLIGIAVVFFGGVAYVTWYKANVLNKIEAAFAPGYDPALELANHPSRGGEIDEDGVRSYAQSGRHMQRKEQTTVDSIMEGKEAGHYFLILGPKGAGKTTMIIDAMRKVDADGVAMCDAHPDLEVFRLRLGKALNFEYNEDSQTGLFQRRDPREGGPRLDIERAMNKLEKVAIRRAAKTGRPLVMVFNNIHLIQNNDEGKQLLQQLQQRAESWAESGIVTMVFNSDDFWPFPVMRQIANRMQILGIKDLDPKDAFTALKKLRCETIGKANLESDELLQQAADVAGGRLAYLSRIARSREILHYADRLKQDEKAWLTTNIGLIPDCDDDVMDEQKWSSCSWLLLREFVKRRIAQEEALKQEQEANPDAILETPPSPSIPYFECRKIMTRPDFLDGLDHLNIIAIDVHHNVRLDSGLTLQAAREIVEEEGFDELLDGVRDRVDEIESLHRTRELTFKDVQDGDRVRVMVDKGGWRLFK
ncbi:hypothetical protein BDV93DRAFT_519312 [Ceratobasidium sp. AG-I]|nr:hypothetical protein BDV93DRAFT_519312 [Ceratobasidium sp. AG-I]